MGSDGERERERDDDLRPCTILRRGRNQNKNKLGIQHLKLAHLVELGELVHSFVANQRLAHKQDQVRLVHADQLFGGAEVNANERRSVGLRNKTTSIP